MYFSNRLSRSTGHSHWVSSYWLDVIFGMEWLRATILNSTIIKTITLIISDGLVVQFSSIKEPSSTYMISVLKANLFLKEGYQSYYAYNKEWKKKRKRKRQCKKSRFFWNSWTYSLMTSQILVWEIELSIDLVQGQAPIFKAYYRMVLNKGEVVRTVREKLNLYECAPWECWRCLL